MGKFSTWLLCSFILAVCTGSLCAAEPDSTNSVQQSPSIQMMETSYAFGEIIEAGEISHDFPVKNTGTANLEINQVQPG